jgi:hypothetical protein
MAWTPPASYTNTLISATDMNLIRDNLRELWHEINYTEFTSSVSVTSTNSASPTDVVSSGAITYANVPHLIEFYAPQARVETAKALLLMLWDGATDLGIIGQVGNAASNTAPSVFLARRLTPTAASHTYRIRAYVTAGTTTTLEAGAGGVNVTMPGTLRIWAKGGA